MPMQTSSMSTAGVRKMLKEPSGCIKVLTLMDSTSQKQLKARVQQRLQNNTHSSKEGESENTKEIGAEHCRFISSAPLVPFLIRIKTIITTTMMMIISMKTAVAVRKKWKSIKAMKTPLTTVE